MANEIGVRIKNRRKEMKLTQMNIYEKVGISSGHLSEIENGKILPSANSLISLSEILDCSIDWILTGNEKSRNNDNDIFLNNREKKILTEFRKLMASEQSEIESMIAFLLYKRESGKSSASETTKSAHESA